MQANVIVALLLLLSFVVVGVWDIYANFGLPPGQTVSWVLQDWSRQWPVLPLVMGLLLGHLLWPRGGLPNGLPIMERPAVGLRAGGRPPVDAGGPSR